MAKITVQDLLAAGVHFGHQTKRWNPKMREFVYGVKNGIYIIDLANTMHQLAGSCNFLQHIVEDGGQILFVGTKRQAQEVVKEAAEKTDSYFVTERWLGGALTNNKTIKRSVKRMQEIDEQLERESSTLKKKEIARLTRTSNKLHRNLDGIAKMDKLPAALVVVDVCHEHIAVAEAVKLKIPVVAIIDTNANPDSINYPIVANDDAVKSISVLIGVIADSIKVASEIYAVKAAEEKKRLDEEKAIADAEKKKAREEAAKAKKEAAKAAKETKAKAPAKKAPAKKKVTEKKPTEKAPVAEKKAAEKKSAEKAPVVEKKVKEAKKEKTSEAKGE
jgi:small subunit ribosomal protein S2